jgi:cobyric acid synthase
VADLAYLRDEGLAQAVVYQAGQGTAVAGICGGFQMLGRRIRDPHGIESADGLAEGLGLLAVDTVLAAEKTLVRTTARHAASGHTVHGYEIHHGRTAGEALEPIFTRPDGAALGAARPDHRVWGTYLHGVFDADAFRRWFIDRLRARKGLAPLDETCGHYDIEPEIDRLAEVVRASLQMDEIYRLLRLG